MNAHPNTRRIAAVVAIVALFASCSTGTETDPGGRAVTEKTAAQAQEWLAGLAAWDFRGAVALVEGGKEDQEVFTSGFGVLDPEQDSGQDAGTIGPRTRFAIGSVTKLITRLAVLLLEDRGQLHDDDRLGHLLPGVPPDKASITVGQLAAHTAGLPDYHGLDEEQITKTQALERIFGQELLFAPGSQESYSNSGYTVLASIIEEVSGRGFDDFLREEIFAPTGMTDAGFQGDPLPPGGSEAVGSSASGNTDAPSLLPPVGWALRGNGGVVASLNDLLALDHAVFHSDLLSDAARQRLVGAAEGLVLTAGGGGLTSHTSLVGRQLQDDRVLVVLSADARFAAEDIAVRLFDLIQGDQVPAPPQLSERGPDEVAEVTGTYRSDSGATVTVAAHPDGLRLVPQDRHAFADLFPLRAKIPGIAPVDQVVGLVESIDDPGYREWLTEQTAALGPLEAIEPVGVAPVGEPEPVTFLRHRFARGSVLTGWTFSPQGEALVIDLEPEPPGVTFRPAAGDDGGFVSYSVTQTPLAERVRFSENGVMTLQTQGRSVGYRRDG
jgi:CubicO group peptidase (beta-lactamase class C family)